MATRRRSTRNNIILNPPIYWNNFILAVTQKKEISYFGWIKNNFLGTCIIIICVRKNKTKVAQGAACRRQGAQRFTLTIDERKKESNKKLEENDDERGYESINAADNFFARQGERGINKTEIKKRTGGGYENL